MPLFLELVIRFFLFFRYSKTNVAPESIANSCRICIRNVKCEIFIYDQKQILQSNLLGLEKILFLAIAALVKSNLVPLHYLSYSYSLLWFYPIVKKQEQGGGSGKGITQWLVSPN